MPTEDVAIRQRLDAAAQAIRAKDIEALMPHYTPDVVTFDVLPPPQVSGASAYRKNFQAWFGSAQGPIDYEMHDVRIAAHGDIAFCHYRGHVKLTRKNGHKADYWVRVSAGFRRVDGAWLIAHEHVSMPADMAALGAA